MVKWTKVRRCCVAMLGAICVWVSACDGLAPPDGGEATPASQGTVEQQGGGAGPANVAGVEPNEETDPSVSPDGSGDATDDDPTEDTTEPGHQNESGGPLIDCGTPDFRCGYECLPKGVVMGTVWQFSVEWAEGIVLPESEKRVQVARDQATLKLLIDPDSMDAVDFLYKEVILFSVPPGSLEGCGPWPCVSGVVDLDDDQRRALVIGNASDGVGTSCSSPSDDRVNALVVPLSDRPVVMFFINRDGRLAEIVEPILSAE